MNNQLGPAGQRYNLLAGERDVYLTSAREASKYTLPALIPEHEMTSGQKFYEPWQSLGSRGVRNLASKLLLTLFPSTQSFFRLSVSEKLKKDLPEQDRPAWDQALAAVERVVRKLFDSKAFRVPLYEGLKHLVVGGNVTLHIPATGSMRVFRLSQYVVRREPTGLTTELIVKESVDIDSLPPSVWGRVKSRVDMTPSTTKPQTVDVYTWVKKSQNRYTVEQEAAGISIPEASGSYPLDRCPWIVLRWTRVDGEHYGRGHVEELIGDLKSFENLRKASVEAGAISARVIFAARPGAITNPKDIAEAPNGSFIVGNPDDIKAIQAERFADMQVVDKQSAELKQDLSFQFLLNSAVSRDAERVTAEEIRYMAQELESALGGVYSVLSADFQLPLVRVLLANAQKSGDLPAIPDGSVDLTVTTGFDALGRTSDIMKLNEMLTSAANVLGPQVIGQYVSPEAYLKKAAASYGIETDGLIRTEQDIAQMNNVQMTQELAAKAAPNLVNAISNHAMAAQQPQTPNA